MTALTVLVFFNGFVYEKETTDNQAAINYLRD
jgi:hypothetical protein